MHQNLRLGALELDLVARLGELVAIVEVRSRGPGAWQSGHASVDPTKRQRLRRAGWRLWRRLRHSGVGRLRFDTASVRFSGELALVDYVTAAF